MCSASAPPSIQPEQKPCAQRGAVRCQGRRRWGRTLNQGMGFGEATPRNTNLGCSNQRSRLGPGTPEVFRAGQGWGVGSPVPKLLHCSESLSCSWTRPAVPLPQGCPHPCPGCGHPHTPHPQGLTGQGHPPRLPTPPERNSPQFPGSQRAAPTFSRRLLLLNCANEMTLIKAIAPQPEDGCCRLSRAPQPQPCPSTGRDEGPRSGDAAPEPTLGDTGRDPVFTSETLVPGPGAGTAPARGLWHRPPSAAHPGAVTPTGDGDRDRDGFGMAGVQHRTAARLLLLLCQPGAGHSTDPLLGLSPGRETPARAQIPAPAPGWQQGTRGQHGEVVPGAAVPVQPQVPATRDRAGCGVGCPGTTGSVSLPATSRRCPCHGDPLALTPQVEASVDRSSW